MLDALQNQDNLTLIEAAVEGLLTDSGRVNGVTLADGTELRAAAVVLTTGTFLNGVMFVGHEATPGRAVSETRPVME